MKNKTVSDFTFLIITTSTHFAIRVIPPSYLRDLQVLSFTILRMLLKKIKIYHIC